MATTTTANIYEMLAIIHKPEPELLNYSRPDVLRYLDHIAEAMLKGWFTTLEKLATQSKYMRQGNPALTIELLQVFRCTEANRGIMKNCVFINHQWVLKLGNNAITEAITYDEASPSMQQKLVPTVLLGEFGCVQLKVILPKNSQGWGFDDTKIERQYNNISHDNEDVHRGNVGIWQGRLMHLDFAGT